MSSLHLTSAKIKKNDEFYTRDADVERELEFYIAANPDIFRRKTVYCPADCALYAQSSFYRYFKANFARLGLRKLICTSYATFTDERGNKRGFYYSYSYQTFPPTEEEAKQGKKGTWRIEEWARALDGDGDFTSPECAPFWEEADFVITNPPFSRVSKDFINLLQQYNVFYLFIGAFVTCTYIRFFKQIFLGRMWFGATQVKTFDTPDGERTIACVWYTNMYHEAPQKQLPHLRTMAENRDKVQGTKSKVQGSKYKVQSSAKRVNSDERRENTATSDYNLGFTLNLEPCTLNLIKASYLKDGFRIARQNALPEEEKNSPYQHLYVPYDNYDAIEVPRLTLIPTDYYGKIGVPITILQYIIHPRRPEDIPTQTEISEDTRKQLGIDEFGIVDSLPVQCDNNHHRQYRGAVVNNKMLFSRIIIQRLPPDEPLNNEDKSQISNLKSQILGRLHEPHISSSTENSPTDWQIAGKLCNHNSIRTSQKNINYRRNLRPTRSSW